MTNRIHLIALPKKETGLQSVLKPLHMRYAQRFNRQRGWKGHVWQGRYFSSALDEQYLWAAIRYVERNPVRAKMVKKAENYAWYKCRCALQRYCSIDRLVDQRSRKMIKREASPYCAAKHLMLQCEYMFRRHSMGN